MPGEIGSTQARERYLNSDKNINLRNHLENLDKEEKAGLKGIEIRATAKQLGKDDFLKLLITQLSHQDPTAPVKDQDFIAQMAQFSSLEQMKNMSGAINKMGERQSYSLVGKIVSGPDMLNGETIVGLAGALFFDSEGKSYVRVNGKSIEVDRVTLISEPSLISPDPVGQSQAPAAVQNEPAPAVQAANNTTIQEENSKSELEPEAKAIAGAEKSPESPLKEVRKDWEFPGKKKEIIINNETNKNEIGK